MQWYYHRAAAAFLRWNIPRLERERGCNMIEAKRRTRCRVGPMGKLGIIGICMSVGIVFAVGSSTLSLAATKAPALNPAQIAAQTFSTKLCTPKNPAVVKNIPKALSGFTGYKQSPGNWLGLPATSDLTGHTVALTTMGLNQPFFTSIGRVLGAIGEALQVQLEGLRRPVPRRNRSVDC